MTAKQILAALKDMRPINKSNLEEKERELQAMLDAEPVAQTLTDEEVVLRVNHIPGVEIWDYKSAEWVDLVAHIRLKHAPKPAWEVAWERYCEECESANDNDDFKAGFEAGQKEAT